MNEEEKRKSWFLYELFGLQNKVDQVFDRWKSSPDKETLWNVANRLWFVDRLRYRTSIQQGRYDPGKLSYSLTDQSFALQHYLLLTCLDALGNQEFIDFPDWLQVSQKKKVKYGVDDSKIKKILDQSADLRIPSNFMKAARQVYETLYLPSHGNNKKFIQVLKDLPGPLKDLLNKAYLISDPVSDVFGEGLLEKEQAKWDSSESGKKTEALGNYFYLVMRNPYTHKAEQTKPDRPLIFYEKDEDNKRFREGLDFINDFSMFGKNRRITRFRGDIVEDEVLILRLVIAIGWLQRLGFNLEEDFIMSFRDYQIRREIIFRSMREVEDAIELASFYREKTYKDLREFYARWGLPQFPMYWATRVKDYLRLDTPNEGGLNARREEYLGVIRHLNNLIADQNNKYSDGIEFIPTTEQGRQLNINMPLAFEVIKGAIKEVDIDDLSNKVYWGLESWSERIV